MAQSIFYLEKCSFSKQVRISPEIDWLCSVSYAGKNGFSAGKTRGVLRGGATGANRGYVLAHCPFQDETKYPEFYL